MFKNYKEGDIIFETDYNNIKSEIDRKWNIKNRGIEEGKKICFEKSVSIPRREFKKNYPKNPIVHNIKEADIIVAKHKPHLYIGFGYGSNKKNQTTLDKINFKYGLDSTLLNLNNCIDYLNNETIKIISPESIVINGEGGELSDESIEKLTLMLKSSDIETVNLGMKILFNHDHTINTSKFFLILCQANKTTWYRRTKSRSIEQKIKYITSLYPNHKL